MAAWRWLDTIRHTDVKNAFCSILVSSSSSSNAQLYNCRWIINIIIHFGAFICVVFYAINPPDPYSSRKDFRGWVDLWWIIVEGRELHSESTWTLTDGTAFERNLIYVQFMGFLFVPALLIPPDFQDNKWIQLQMKWWDVEGLKQWDKERRKKEGEGCGEEVCMEVGFNLDRALLSFHRFKCFRAIFERNVIGFITHHLRQWGAACITPPFVDHNSMP